jgi:hypothetical protein
MEELKDWINQRLENGDDESAEQLANILSAYALVGINKNLDIIAGHIMSVTSPSESAAIRIDDGKP